MDDTVQQIRPSGQLKVAFGVCAFRRPALMQTLDSLTQQTLSRNVDCCVIVADNDDTPTALPLVEAAKSRAGMAIH